MRDFQLTETAADQPLWTLGEEYTLPLPEDETLELALVSVLAPLHDALADSRLAPYAADLSAAIVQVFHRKAETLCRRGSENADEVRRLIREQDGGEIASLELETAIARGAALDEARAAFEAMRDHLAAQHAALTGQHWTPRGSSMTGRTVTAAVIDARDFLSARRQAEIAARQPDGTYIAFTGGPDCQDHDAIWAALDRVRTRHPDMVLLHGGTSRGAEKIAALWARERNVPQIVFTPDFKTEGKKAPFRRNDRLLDAKPVGLIAFPGAGVTDNLADKARARGIPVWQHGQPKPPTAQPATPEIAGIPDWHLPHAGFVARSTFIRR